MIHKNYRTAVDELINICITAGEYEQALPHAIRNLALSIQFDGFDSVDTTQQYIKLAIIYIGLVTKLKELLANQLASEVTQEAAGQPKGALTILQEQKTNTINALNECKQSVITYLLTAKYLITLLGGVHHPELSSIYLKLGLFLVDEKGQFQVGMLCLIGQVRTRITDIIIYAHITSIIADIMYKAEFYEDAVNEQKNVYNIYKSVAGKGSATTTTTTSEGGGDSSNTNSNNNNSIRFIERMNEAREKYALYLRALATSNKQIKVYIYVYCVYVSDNVCVYFDTHTEYVYLTRFIPRHKYSVHTTICAYTAPYLHIYLHVSDCVYIRYIHYCYIIPFSMFIYHRTPNLHSKRRNNSSKLRNKVN